MTIASIECKECGNDLWEDRYDGYLYCTNCLNKRPYIRRNGNNGKPSKSQLQKVEYIETWFKQYFRKDELAKCETTFQNETGFVYLSVETTDHPLTMDGAFFVIGRRGGIKVLSTCGLSKVHNKQFYAKFLDGKVGW